jgi:hypothetical protein
MRVVLPNLRDYVSPVSVQVIGQSV